MGEKNDQDGEVKNTGGRYDPASDSWRPTTLVNAPPVRAGGRRMRIADIERWSLPNLLTFADRNAMAHGVEMRLPFLAPGLVALSLAMPEDVLVRGGWTKWPQPATSRLVRH